MNQVKIYLACFIYFNHLIIPGQDSVQLFDNGIMSTPQRGFKSTQKLEAASRKLSKIKQKESREDLRQFLLDNDRNLPSFKNDDSLNSSPPKIELERQKLQAKKSQGEISQKTFQRLLSELERGRQQDGDYRMSSEYVMSSMSWEWKALFQFLKIVFLSYEFNILDQLQKIDSELAFKIKDLLKMAPGYKPVQYVFTFYALKYNYAVGLIAALLYPLPYSLLFLMIPITFTLPFLAIFILAGMKSGALALLLKYCLHFPKSTFHWIVFLFTVFIGVFLPNNFVFIGLYFISIFLSLYLSEDSQEPSSSQVQQQRDRNHNSSVGAVSIHVYQDQQQQLYKQYKMIDGLPETYPIFSIILLSMSVGVTWLLSRYYDNKYLDGIVQLIPISLLSSSKQMLVFFPEIYEAIIKQTNFNEAAFIATSFLFPGPHSKAFMFLFNHKILDWTIIGYLSLYLPSILLTSVFIAYRYHFYTQTYNNIRMSIQAVGNGLVFSLVVMILKNQECFFNMICYCSIVILVVAKLYKLRQLFAITLGIFLISVRSIILHVNKGIRFQQQGCIGE